MRPSGLVFDSWSLLALLQGEAAGPEVRSLILRAERMGRERSITSVNLGEVWYNVARRRSEAEADVRVEELVETGLDVVPADWALAREAASLKARWRLGYGDSFAAALSKLRNAELVTGDPDFRPLAKEVRIRWV